ncbi:MAG: hypothetical protein AMXMBFR48_15420 [Ignavibacteriales bacterium]
MKWFEIFRTGTHTDSKGNTREWTKEELEEIAEKYNAAGNEAPIVIGHPQDNSPAYGWVKELKLFGDKLLALPSKIMPEFVEAVQKGLYRNRSISLNGDGTLRHVGFLGGTPPAVKGLADVQFNEGEDVVSFEFAEAEEETSPPAPLLGKERGAGEGQEGLKGIEGVKQFSEEEFNEVDQKRRQAEEELARLRMKMRKTEFEQFLNEQIAHGSVTPAMKPKLEQVLEALGAVNMQEKDALGNEVYNFSDGTKANPVAVFKEFVKGLPKVIEFNEVAKKPKPEQDELLTSPVRVAEAEIRKSMALQ